MVGVLTAVVVLDTAVLLEMLLELVPAPVATFEVVGAVAESPAVTTLVVVVVCFGGVDRCADDDADDRGDDERAHADADDSGPPTAVRSRTTMLRCPVARRRIMGARHHAQGTAAGGANRGNHVDVPGLRAAAARSASSPEVVMMGVRSEKSARRFRMKVRIGIGSGRSALSPDDLGALADDLVELGFDSIWLSEVLTGGGLDPLVGLAFVAAHNPILKLGTTMLLPGRNPVRLAKSLASLDMLSGGRLLVTFVPGLSDPPERDAIGLDPRERAAAIDEALPLVRRLLSGSPVTHDGATASFSDVTVTPATVQQPLEFWLGGMVRSSLVRCGRLGDGWLPSLCTPEEASAGRKVIDDAAEEAGRMISPEHFGVSIGYTRETPDERAAAGLRRRSRGRDTSRARPRRPGQAAQLPRGVHRGRLLEVRGAAHRAGHVVAIRARVDRRGRRRPAELTATEPHQPPRHPTPARRRVVLRSWVMPDPSRPPILPFSTTSLDHASERRRDEVWLRAAREDPSSLLLVLEEGVRVPMQLDGTLAWSPLDGTTDDAELIFLGLDEKDRALFALDAPQVPEGATYANLREVGVSLPDTDAAAALEAVAIASWHRRHSHCAACGALTAPEDAGHLRRCPECGTGHFPRLDPAVIMLVSDGDACVLGRRSGAPANRWSTLAGYVEPGESPEAAVAREVHEEVGLEIGAVRYRGSQPWPFPSSLMLAFEADAERAPLRINDEHQEVRWFERAELAAGIADGSIATPGAISAGGFLIRSWLG